MMHITLHEVATPVHTKMYRNLLSKLGVNVEVRSFYSKKGSLKNSKIIQGADDKLGQTPQTHLKQ